MPKISAVRVSAEITAVITAVNLTVAHYDNVIRGEAEVSITVLDKKACTGLR